MANINGRTIESKVAQPYAAYYVTAATTRLDNSTVKVTFKVKAKLTSSSPFLGTGHKRTVYITVSDTKKSVVIKENSESWTDNSWHPEKTIVFDSVSSSAPGDINIKFEVSSTGSNASPSTAGTVAETTYQLTMPPLLTTACGAPSSFSSSPNPFESSISLAWSGASSGVNNAISSYEIQYRTSSDGSTWGSWTALKTISSTSSSGSTSTSSSITRGYYIKYRIRTRGAAGSSYYSGWRESSAIRRNRLPDVPSSIEASPAPFETELTISWEASSDLDSNFDKYELQYRTSTNGSTWGSWTTLYSGTSTSRSHTPSIEDGSYIQYRVRAVDELGAASDYITSDPALRDDGAGFNITIGGVSYKAKAYISVGGEVYKGKPFVSVDGTVHKGVS